MKMSIEAARPDGSAVTPCIAAVPRLSTAWNTNVGILNVSPTTRLVPERIVIGQ